MKTLLSYDVTFIGAGLASSLAVLALKHFHPRLRIAICEPQDAFNLARTWSFQTLSSRIDHSPKKSFTDPTNSWFGGAISKSWPGYQVHFPEYTRTITSPYHSIKAEQLYKLLGTFEGVELFFGRKSPPAEPGLVISATGWPPSQPCGYQKFLGLHVRTKNAYHSSMPMLMDARTCQAKGYRFMYVLPWSPHELLIEDTTYCDHPNLDVSHLESEIHAYAEQQGFPIETVLSREAAALPIPLSMPQQTLSSIPCIGTQAGLYHATTGYSFYEAVVAAETLAVNWQRGPGSVARNLELLAQQCKQRNRFNIRLNNMLFLAAEPEQRRKVFERFYRLPVSTISRFYANQLSVPDKALLLSGRPPVPFARGLYHFMKPKEGADAMV